MKDLYGSVVPDLRLLIYQLFFPSGYQSLKWNVLILLSGLVLLIISEIIRKQFNENHNLNKKKVSKWGILSLSLGVFIPIVGGIILEFIGIEIILNLRHINEKLEKNKELKLREVLRPFFMFLQLLLYIIVFIIFPVGLYILNLFLGNILWILIGIGADVGLIYLIIHKFQPPSIEKWGDKKRNFIGLFLIPFLFLSVFLTCWYFPSPTPAPESQPGTIGTNQLKIVTYNIRNGIALDGEDHWNLRKEYLINQLVDFDSGIIGLQEAYLFQINEIITGLDEKINSRDYEWTGLGRYDGVHYDEHSPILYDRIIYEYQDGGTFWLSDNYKLPTYGYAEGQCCKRIVTWGRFKIKENNSEFVVFCTHYGFGEDFSDPASELLTKKVEALSGGLPAFVVGDFNFDETSSSYEIMKSSSTKPLIDAYSVYYGPGPHEIPTINGFNPNTDRNKKIDFIFLSEQVNVLDCFVDQSTYVREGIERCYSDHYPVIAECQF